MKKTKLFFCAAMAISGAAMTACSSDDPGNGNGNGNGNQQPNPRHQIQLTAEQQKIAKNLDFHFKLWKMMTDAKPTGNHFFSPLGIQMSLSMLANGADDEARKELMAFLGANDLQDLNGFNRVMISELPMVDNTVTFSLANSAWFDIAVTPGQQFADACRSVFGASVAKYEKGSDKAMQEINKWCSDNTGGMITRFLSEPPSADFMLFNAAYFNGKWKEPFDAARTAKGEFICESGRKAEVDMMHLDNVTVRWFRTPGYTTFRLEYGNGGYTMRLVLPAEGRSVNDVMEARVLTEEFLEEEAGVTEYNYGDLDLALPRFGVAGDYPDLADILRNAGLTKTFGATGHFSGIFQGCTPALMRQKTAIQVNESGTVAAAATQTEGITSPGNKPLSITFNRPFGLIITENSTGTLLYMGKVAEL